MTRPDTRVYPGLLLLLQLDNVVVVVVVVVDGTTAEVLVFVSVVVAVRDAITDDRRRYALISPTQNIAGQTSCRRQRFRFYSTTQVSKKIT